MPGAIVTELTTERTLAVRFMCPRCQWRGELAAQSNIPLVRVLGLLSSNHEASSPRCLATAGEIRYRISALATSSARLARRRTESD